MKHWQLRAIVRDPQTEQVLGYGKPFTMPPGAASMWAKKYVRDVEVVSTSFEVPDAYVGQGVVTGVPAMAELTPAGKAYLEANGLAMEGGKIVAPQSEVKWQAGEIHPAVSVSEAKAGKAR